MKFGVMTVTGIFLVSLFLVSCAKKPQEEILGKWKEADGLVTEFFQDGTMTLTNPKEEVLGSHTITGNWIILGDGRLKLTFSMMGQTHIQVGELSFPNKDTMNIKDEDGTISSMARELP
jgi:hypothetical protein